ncbi:aryl-alcohol dehydrogenase-like predicted oxidoreductase [Sphingobacterium siyangense]|uniref:Aryl-alcohol dehydrogenase-like predicted oxidoreductase n=2 Tax=Sphingobacterium siyangense TaxID=459529 RepID=A0A562M8C4_9SPHI|nr:aryl-alcohol dehydrogenase-like predicted oxidoreductase [Sphingobacterium siyangense]
MIMEKVKLGNSEIEFKPLVFGGNVFGWTVDEKQSFALLDAFIDMGFSLIDTSNNYSHWVPGHSGSESETIIGKWISKRDIRDKIQIATKVGGRRIDNSKPNLKKEYIIKSVEDSLLRLNVDTIDLYQSHHDDLTTGIDETLEAYHHLIQNGKIKWIGASNLSPERISESLQMAEDHNLPYYIAIQPEYNLYDRMKYEEQYEQLAIDNHLGVISYYSLASGFLSGKYRSIEDIKETKRYDALKDKFNARGLRILDVLAEIAHTQQASMSAIALAWSLHRPSVTAPIVSATSIQQLEELSRAVEIKLTPEECFLLDKASSY